MSELEILYEAFENIKTKKVLDLEFSINAFNETEQTIKCHSNIYKNKETGILKINCDSKINTADIKCIHKIENETNLKSICEKYKKCNDEKLGSLDFLENFVDLSVFLSLLGSLEIEESNNEIIANINLRDFAKELKEEDFDCFEEGANSHLVTVSKIILNDISSDKYDSIILKGHISKDKTLDKITIKGSGKHTLDINAISK